MQWEYWCVNKPAIDSSLTETAEFLDYQGEQGWELVSVVYVAEANIAPMGQTMNRIPLDQVRYYFKRPTKSPPPPPNT